MKELKKFAKTEEGPHRGMKSEKNQWRIFARLTHKSILPTRQQTSILRKHSQVYLDASEFSW